MDGRGEDGAFTLTFRNTGGAGAVFHVYDRLHFDRIPRRYTVEARKAHSDAWLLHAGEGQYDLWVYGPNGLVREFRGTVGPDAAAIPEVELRYDPANRAIRLIATNQGHGELTLAVRANAYRTDGPWTLRVRRDQRVVREFSLIASHNWYDFTVVGEQFERRFAGRMETGAPSVSDPAI